MNAIHFSLYWHSKSNVLKIPEISTSLDSCSLSSEQIQSLVLDLVGPVQCKGEKDFTIMKLKEGNREGEQHF